MEIVRSVAVPGPAERAFDLVDDLASYPRWMDLVHDVAISDSGSGDPAWDVELQAQVGPFTRSKRLRMVRTVHEPYERVVFERSETDGREHAAWVLAVDLVATNSVGSDTSTVEVTMALAYGGRLWTGAVLQRVLDDHVERGADSLVRLLSPDR